MKEKHFKIIFIIVVAFLLISAIYIYLFKQGEKTIMASKLNSNKKESLISNNIRIGIVDFDNINPILSNNKNVQDISRLIFDPLFTLTQEYKLEGLLARECSKIANKTYIIKLNSNIVWHDGNKFDSSDVIFTINMLKELRENSIYYHNIKNIAQLQEIDEFTIKIITDSDISYFEYNLIFPIISSKYFNEENLNKASKNTKPVGTGIFYISDVNNKNILLKRNLENERAANLKIETITLKLYSSLSSIIEAFKTEEIDIFTTSNKSVEEYLKNTRYNIGRYINREHNYLTLNCNNEVLSNTEVRQAINYAINKEEILKDVLDNKYEISNFPLDFGSFAYDISNEHVIYDTNKSKNILVENGWKYSEEGWKKKVNNKNLKIELDIVVNKNTIDNIKVANNIKEQLSLVGILINLNEVSDREYNNYLKNKNYDLIILSDTYSYSPSLEKYFGANNLSNYTNEKIKRLLKEVEFLDDENEIKQKYTRINKIYNDEIPYISLYYDTSAIIYSTNLKGIITPNSYNLFYGIESWYREYEK